MKKHKRTHPGDKPCEYDKCGASFNGADELKRQEKI